MAATDQTIELTGEFETALDLLSSGSNMFLTGKAGTGKSTLIRHFMDRTDRNVTVVAPTGIAALNVNGYTIHRLLSLRTDTTLSDIRSGNYYPSRFAKVLKQLQTLIVDEASMVRADLFDQLAAALERFGPQPGAAFGGVQIVLVGDLFQLPPVTTEAEVEYFSSTYATPYFFSANSYREPDFPTVALTKVFRQAGDSRLTSILNAIREGAISPAEIDDLNSRVQTGFEPPEGEFWLTLATTNRIANARNRQRLERLPAPELTSMSAETGDLSLLDPPAEPNLTYKVGAQVMMLTNDPRGRWVNGSIGEITEVGHSADGPVVAVRFTDGTDAECTPHTWEATRPVIQGGQLTHEVIGTFTQLPFRLAWAITIHKSQGQTLDRLVVDLSGGTFAFGQLYVALSRSTSMDGLVLQRPVLPKDLKTDRRIVRFLSEATSDTDIRGHCAIAISTVGEEGRMFRPRPVELAIAFDDGTAVSTLINPGCDLYDAKQRLGISVADVLLAPNLAEAWSVLTELIDGWAPAGSGIDQALGLIDAELKRHGVITRLPIGTDVGAIPAKGSALDQARAALAAFTAMPPAEIGTMPFARQVDSDTFPYLLTRDPGVTPPPRNDQTSHTLNASSRLSNILLGSGPHIDDTMGGATAEKVAESLRAKTAGASLPPEVLERLDIAAASLGHPTLDPAIAAGATASIGEVLKPGVRVCFTGTVTLDSGKTLSRTEMKAMARNRELEPVDTVTKSKCDALVVAELGSQSGKSKKAADLGKPVFSAAEFADWCGEA